MLASGHYANVVRLDDRTGIARHHRRRRHQAAGRRAARPLGHGRHRLRGDERQRRHLRRRRAAGDGRLPRRRPRRRGGRGSRSASAWPRGAELAGIEIVGGELAQLGELIRGLDLAGACFGVVALDSLITGAAIEPGDAVIGLPSSGLHSNGYTLARTALAEVPTGRRPPRPPARRGPAGADRDLRQAGARADRLRRRGPRPRPHHLRRPRQPAAPGGRGRLRDRRPAAGAAGLRADPGAGRRRRRGDARGLQHGLRLLLRRRGGGRGARARAAAGALPRGEAHRPGAAAAAMASNSHRKRRVAGENTERWRTPSHGKRERDGPLGPLPAGVEARIRRDVHRLPRPGRGAGPPGGREAAAPRDLRGGPTSSSASGARRARRPASATPTWSASSTPARTRAAPTSSSSTSRATR